MQPLTRSVLLLAGCAAAAAAIAASMAKTHGAAKADALPAAWNVQHTLTAVRESDIIVEGAGSGLTEAAPSADQTGGSQPSGPADGQPGEKFEESFADVDDPYPYVMFARDKATSTFSTYAEALDQAKRAADAVVRHRTSGAVVWSSDAVLPDEVRMELEPIVQLPELERGCEVTSLAMLLRAAGIDDADKMTLADQIAKDAAPFEIYDGFIHFGNPNIGFVGDMVTFDKPGYGVYHEPVMKLAKRYLGGRAVDATGADFPDIEQFLARGVPVWVIVNMDYEPLDDEEFQTWVTPEGMIDITYREHAVLVTGYDDDTIYFNDPLGEDGKADRRSFVGAWEQMGRQAIAFDNTGEKSRE